MFLCPDCQRLYHGVPVSESEGLCEVCQNIAVCGDMPRYERRTDRELSAEIKRLREALREIMKGEGRFSQLPIEHAENTIDDMKQLARDALGETQD